MQRVFCNVVAQAQGCSDTTHYDQQQHHNQQLLCGSTASCSSTRSSGRLRPKSPHGEAIPNGACSWSPCSHAHASLRGAAGLAAAALRPSVPARRHRPHRVAQPSSTCCRSHATALAGRVPGASQLPARSTHGQSCSPALTVPCALFSLTLAAARSRYGAVCVAGCRVHNKR